MQLIFLYIITAIKLQQGIFCLTQSHRSVRARVRVIRGYEYMYRFMPPLYRPRCAYDAYQRWHR